MLEKCSHALLLILLLTFPPPAFAQGAGGEKSRDVLVREFIAELDSNDIHVAARAARELGYRRAAEGVPAMLRVLQSSRFLSLSEHQMAADKNSVSEWVVTDVRYEIVTALGLIGDRRAVPVLKKYLKEPPENSAVYTGSVAWALYQITGRSYKYKDRDGQMKLFRPSGSIAAPSN
jgi:hypothetical protein